ncbi:MAG: VanW family protein [Lachnospiraceae bacterium]|nr:VanW family protein [Lachnospiraceae bacterium]
MKKKKARRTLSVISIILVLGIAYVLFCMSQENSLIRENRVVNGVSIAGRTRAEAESAVRQAFLRDYQDSAFTVTIGEESYRIPVAGALDIDLTEALSGTTTNADTPWYLRGIRYVQEKTGTAPQEETLTVRPYLADPDVVRSAVEASGIDSYNSLVQSSWTNEGGTIVIHKGKNGESADMDALADLILSKMEEGTFTGTVACPTNVVEADSINVIQIASQFLVPVQEPRFARDENGELITIPAQEGATVDLMAFKAAYDAAGDGEDVTVEIQTVKPSMTTEEFEQTVFDTELSSYYTYGGTTANKEINQALAVSTVNGAILLPGEEFSYLGLIGDTTPDKGYVLENAYQEGRVVKEYGGGICQVSSTIYAAVLYTELEVTERYNHSMPVGYIPSGMDATVSYPSANFRFKNTLGYPIKLQVTYDYNDGMIRAAILGHPNGTEPTIEIWREGIDVSKDYSYGVQTFRVYLDEDGDVIKKVSMGSSRYKELNWNKSSSETA